MRMPSPDDFNYEAALAACARGDSAALRRLYAQECPRLLGVVQRIVRNLPQAQDLVHDAFINIWNRAGSYEPSRGSARGWMYTIARNLALNAVRDGSRETELGEEAWGVLDAEASMEAWRDVQDGFQWQDAAGRMGLCLERLEPVRRNCVLHAYLDGLSHAEIAQRVNAPLGTVKAWIKRSLSALKECLQ